LELRQPGLGLVLGLGLGLRLGDGVMLEALWCSGYCTLNLLTNKSLVLIEAGSRSIGTRLLPGPKVICTDRSRGLLFEVLRYLLYLCNITFYNQYK